MKISSLSAETQHGLLRWAHWQHNDDMLFDGIGSSSMEWAWIWFELRAAEDRPEWFPKGKSATIQAIEGLLLEQAARERREP